ncbi:cysteine desulfurase family protein [Marininema halotolerans]|uniref:cysteine desulfurase n=1 Tax=Marininema halotolerans TaxID=1155944 RepID=A0A1I6Q217_9BACL|nr:cysteine desulfurase family protein [Marininema halotolerans]SFS46506.1 cysteine desulfurase [Marininema halotolerans]
MKRLYFDHGATTPLRPEVRKAIIDAFDHFGNPSSLHDEGTFSNEMLELARNQVARAIGASPREIIFTSSGTEANNIAIIGTARRLQKQGNHIITSQVEHPSVLDTCRSLEREGFDLTILPVDRDGAVDPEDVKKAITPKTILVSIMAANNEVGTLMPIKEIASLLQEQNIRFHTDAIQYFGKKPLDVNQLGVDFLSISGHKVNALKGIGALYIRKGVRIDPILFGGGQERGLRPATHNMTGIISLGVAAELAAKEVPEREERLTQLRNHLWEQIQQRIPDVALNGHPEKRLPNNLNLRFDRVEGQAILLELSRAGIAVSSGSACSAGKGDPSHVLKAMGQPDETAHQSLRITLGCETTLEMIEQLVVQLELVLKELRRRIQS